MKLRYSSLALIFGALIPLAACSLINSYDDILPDDDGSTGGGGGLGGMTNSGSGGDENPMGGGDGTGGETIVDPIDPGLVVVGGDTDANTATINDRFIIALDPRTGMELTRTETGSYEAFAYEASRDVWFFIKDSKLRAAKFNRVSLEFEAMGNEITVATVVDPNYVFALTDSVSIMDENQVLNIYDTSDLDDIKPSTVPQLPLPTSGTFPGETRELWNARSVASNTAGSVYVLWTQCSVGDDECTVRLSRLQPSSPSAMPPTVDVEVLVGVATDVVPDKRGVLGIDALAGLVLAYVPDYDMVAPNQGKLYRFTGALSPQPALPLKENGPRQAGLEVDACASVAFMKDITAAPLVAAGLQVDASQVDVSVGINGQGMVFEPYTSSLLLMQASGENVGVTAWESRGTTDEPAMAKRQATWRAPALNPFLIEVEAPLSPVCE